MLSCKLRKREPFWVNSVAGGFGSITAEFCTFPIDISKTRMQLQGSRRIRSKPYKGLFDCIYTITRTEGLSGLFRGIVPGICRQASYSSIRMGVYEPLRNAISHTKDIPIYKRILAGGSAGVVGCVAANPFDLIKIRMQADSTGRRYSEGILRSLKQIIKTEGVKGLWMGVLPNVQRAFFVNAAELASYDATKQYLLSHKIMGDHIGTYSCASFCAGFLAALVSNPVDLSKTRLMNQETPRMYSGMMDCILKTVKNEGVLALYKGFVPNWVRIGSWCVVMFVTWEQCRHAAQVLWDK